MQYLERSHNSEFLPKLLGSYELELSQILDDVIREDHSVIVDVGCAEGYYAVGLALRCPAARVFAFDQDAEAQRACRETALRNQVAERVEVLGACDPEALNRLPLAGALLVCDCEGYELDLLTPELVPGLRSCDILVELHDHLNAEITPALLRRFLGTHTAQLIPSVIRNPDTFPSLWFARKRRDRQIAVDEQRVPMNWAYFRVRAEGRVRMQDDPRFNSETVRELFGSMAVPSRSTTPAPARMLGVNSPR
jgi:hypothetical protein